jgi:hypothetical protein
VYAVERFCLGQIIVVSPSCMTAESNGSTEYVTGLQPAAAALLLIAMRMFFDVVCRIPNAHRVLT